MNIAEEKDAMKLPDDSGNNKIKKPRKSAKTNDMANNSGLLRLTPSVPDQPSLLESKANPATEMSTESLVEKMIEYEKNDVKDHTEQEKGVLSHLGEYIEEPFTIIESYFRGQHV